MFLSMKSLRCVGPMIEKCTHGAPLTLENQKNLKLWSQFYFLPHCLTEPTLLWDIIAHKFFTFMDGFLYLLQQWF